MLITWTYFRDEQIAKHERFHETDFRAKNEQIPSLKTFCKE
jgi:hypothetical protein